MELFIVFLRDKHDRFQRVPWDSITIYAEDKQPKIERSDYDLRFTIRQHVWFLDEIDLNDPIPPGIRCIACRKVLLPNGRALAEGDFFEIVRTDTNELIFRGSLRYDPARVGWGTKPCREFMAFDLSEITEDGEVEIEAADGVGELVEIRITQLGHVLIDKVKDGKIVKQ